MLKDFTTKYLYLFSSLFIALLSFGFYFEFPIAIIIPPVLLIIYLAVFRLDTLFWIVVFSAPLSVNLEKLELGGIGFFLPTEPILFGLLLIIFFKKLVETKNTTTSNHPFIIVFTIYFVWLLITSITSQQPVVSFKFLVAKLWLVVPVFYFGLKLFKKTENIKKYIWLYIIPLAIVITYTLIRHASFGFSEAAGHWVMQPFFKDHTSYGAILALIFPTVVVFYQLSKKESITRFFLALLIILFCIGLYYSYTRAAWLSVVGGIAVWFIIKYKVKVKYLVTLALIGVGFLVANITELGYSLKKNESEHATEDIGERLKSMSNISTDASNLERLNRWTAALNMFEERPVFGFGPGTYSFEYAPFQDPKKESIISTNFGDMGNAHSEYLGPLSETGLIGLIIILSIIFLIFYRSIRLYYQIESKELKSIVLALIVGLSTYFAHGILNNYLDTDKASIPVWGFCAIIMAIEIHHKDKLKKSTAQ